MIILILVRVIAPVCACCSHFFSQGLVASFAMNPTQPFPVCLSRLWHYSWPVGDATHGWSLLLEHGIWWRIDPDGQRRMIDMAVSSMYYYDATSRRWIDLELHPFRRHWDRWHHLATRLLPHIDYNIQNGSWTVARVKQWSDHGRTRRYGVVGNFCLAMVVDMALASQVQLGVRESWFVKRLNMAHKADLLEAVMGLRDLYPAGWAAWGDMVDHLCTAVYEAWPLRGPFISVWNHTEAFRALFDHFELATFIAWASQDARTKRRQEFHLAFRPRFRACQSVIDLIWGFFSLGDRSQR